MSLEILLDLNKSCWQLCQHSGWTPDPLKPKWLRLRWPSTYANCKADLLSSTPCLFHTFLTATGSIPAELSEAFLERRDDTRRHFARLNFGSASPRAAQSI